MTASSRLGGTLVAFGLALLPATALADPPPLAPPSEEQVQAARVPYREARELHRQGKLKEALERALEAYRIASTPVTALEAGQLLVESGRLVEARDVVRSVVAFPVSPRESDKGRESRQQAAALGATLDARIPKLAIAGRPAGVDAFFDGKALAASDPTAWLGVDPGPHALVVRAGERTCTTINVTLAEAEARTIDLHDVASTCRVDAAATLAGESAVPSPAANAVAQPDRAVTAPSPLPAPPPRDGSTSSTWRWVGVAVAGAGVVAVGAGGGVALSAKSNYDAVASQCPARGCSTSAFDVRESARSQADAATVAMVVGAAAFAGGALLFFLAPGSGSAETGRPVVGIGPTSVRIALRFP
jgi:serine/threonine-protein kinase